MSCRPDFVTPVDGRSLWYSVLLAIWLGTGAAAFSWFQSKTFSERDPTWRDRQEDSSKAACEIYCGDATALRVRTLSFSEQVVSMPLCFTWIDAVQYLVQVSVVPALTVTSTLSPGC